MTELETYLCKCLEQIMHLENVFNIKVYNHKKKRFEFTISDFKWVGLGHFLEIIERSLRHKFGKDAKEYFAADYEMGKEGRHNVDFILTIKPKVDLEVLAGYLRIMNGY